MMLVIWLVFEPPCIMWAFNIDKYKVPLITFPFIKGEDYFYSSKGCPQKMYNFKLHMLVSPHTFKDFCLAQPQLQLWLMLALYLTSPTTPPNRKSKNTDQHLDIDIYIKQG